MIVVVNIPDIVRCVGTVKHVVQQAVVRSVHTGCRVNIIYVFFAVMAGGRRRPGATVKHNQIIFNLKHILFMHCTCMNTRVSVS